MTASTKGQAVASRSLPGRGKVTAPIFLLVPQVKLPKRLDLPRMGASGGRCAWSDRGELCGGAAMISADDKVGAQR